MTDYNYERDIRPVETMDWNAATRNVRWDEQEQQPLETEEIVNTWREQTPEGQEFAIKYNTEANRKALLAALEIVGEISWPALTDTFQRLKGNRKLVVYQAPPTPAQVEQSNKAKWEADCLAWYRAPGRSTREIKTRLESDHAFNRWFQDHRFEVGLEDAGAIPAKILGASEQSAGYHPDTIDFMKEQIGEEKRLNKEYAKVDPELRTFAQEYLRMPANEVRRRTQLDREFRQKVDAAARAGLL